MFILSQHLTNENDKSTFFYCAESLYTVSFSPSLSFYISFKFLLFSRGKERQGVNFTNVLCASFLQVSFACGFLCLHFRFIIYWRKIVGAKAAHRMLMKLNQGEEHSREKSGIMFQFVNVNVSSNFNLFFFFIFWLRPTQSFSVRFLCLKCELPIMQNVISFFIRLVQNHNHHSCGNIPI